MSIVLEEINPTEAPEESKEISVLPDAVLMENTNGGGDEEKSIEGTVIDTPSPVTVATPKKRGRPKKEAAPVVSIPENKVAPVAKAAAPKTSKAKAAPKEKKPKPPPIIEEEDSSESDVDETLRNVYNHVARPDMETAILQFLVNRKQTETQRRRTLWSQLAQM